MKVLLVDDHPATRLGVRVLLRSVEDARIVGETTHHEETLRLAADVRPDLVIVDPEFREGRKEWGFAGGSRPSPARRGS